jgi:two-component system cell cycle sensor histidine kinase/response regulator CckA
VLLVEYDPGVRALVYEVLEEQGYTVLQAADGAAAFEVARAYGETIDLIVTDLVMPKLDGRALVTQLASLNPNLRVLAMSGYADDTPAEKIAHRESFLRKPFTIEELTTAVRRLLDD